MICISLYLLARHFSFIHCWIEQLVMRGIILLLGQILARCEVTVTMRRIKRIIILGMFSPKGMLEACNYTKGCKYGLAEVDRIKREIITSELHH